ncbi:MAG TPA: PH domain-containing protein [Alphaproteobacteria bacterium]
MSYVDRVIQPGEDVVYRAPLHWVIYARGLLFLAVGGLALVIGGSFAATEPDKMRGIGELAIAGLGLIAVIAGAISVIVAFVRRRTTEIAVTTRRVIYKTGVIRRLTSELSVEKIETVLVEQGILGRILNYGTVIIRGTGGGLEPVQNIDDPLTFRSKLTAR